MEPQVTAEYYMITITDDYASAQHYYKKHLEVPDFINSFNWEIIRHFTVEPVERLAQWELDLLGCVEEEAVKEVAKTEVVANFPDEEEWRVIESLPVRSFEINREGIIRHRATKRFMEQEFDIDHNTYRTLLKVNGMTMSIYGKHISDAMWKEDSNAS